MYRKAMIVAICFAALALGCEKKEPEKKAPPVVTRIPPKVPAGMMQLGQRGSVFIDQKPVAVGEYVAYLEATGQPVPDKWQGIEPGTLTGTAPALGLSRQQADWYAAFVMKRVLSRFDFATARETTVCRVPRHLGLAGVDRAGRTVLFGPAEDILGMPEYLVVDVATRKTHAIRLAGMATSVSAPYLASIPSHSPLSPDGQRIILSAFGALSKSGRTALYTIPPDWP